MTKNNSGLFAIGVTVVLGALAIAGSLYAEGRKSASGPKRTADEILREYREAQQRALGGPWLCEPSDPGGVTMGEGNAGLTSGAIAPVWIGLVGGDYAIKSGDYSQKLERMPVGDTRPQQMLLTEKTRSNYVLHTVEIEPVGRTFLYSMRPGTQHGVEVFIFECNKKSPGTKKPANKP